MNYWEQISLLEDKIWRLQCLKNECQNPLTKEKYATAIKEIKEQIDSLSHIDRMNRDYYLYRDYDNLLRYYINKAYSDGLYINDYKEI